MKIGDFARKHKISIDTVRYYLNLQLILAEKSGSQYRFTDKDSEDMEEIIEFKQLKFSLSEIENMLTYKRLVGNKAKEFKSYFISSLEGKKQELNRNKEELDNALSYINRKIYEIESEEKNLTILGLPIKALDILICPYCRSRIDLFEGSIEKNMIVSGKFGCECGNELIIHNGIFIDKNCIKEKIIPTKAEYYEKTSSEFINFIFKSISISIDMINNDMESKEYIMELSNCSGFFLMNYLPNLKKDTTYIIVDNDLNKLKRFKRNLEINNHINNFLFICCDFDKLPIMDDSVDLIIDCFTTDIHGGSQGEILSKSYLPLLKFEKSYVGLHSYFDSNKRSIKNIPDKSRNYYNRETLIDMLEKSKLEQIDIRDNGPAEKGGQYNLYVEGNNYCNLIFHGKKEANL